MKEALRYTSAQLLFIRFDICDFLRKLLVVGIYNKQLLRNLVLFHRFVAKALLRKTSARTTNAQVSP